MHRYVRILRSEQDGLGRKPPGSMLLHLGAAPPSFSGRMGRGETAACAGAGRAGLDLGGPPHRGAARPASRKPSMARGPAEGGTQLCGSLVGWLWGCAISHQAHGSCARHPAVAMHHQSCSLLPRAIPRLQVEDTALLALGEVGCQGRSHAGTLLALLGNSFCTSMERYACPGCSQELFPSHLLTLTSFAPHPLQ